MKIAILTFDGFNEIDSFVAYGILNRMKQQKWKAYITSPTPTVTSMNGVVVTAERQLEFVEQADAVLIGSGIQSLAISRDQAILKRLLLDPAKQLIGSQCSGALLLAKLGLLKNLPVCADMNSKAEVESLGVEVLDKPFYASGNIASAGGCLASQYLATWILVKLGGIEAASYCIDYIAPVGENEKLVSHALGVVNPFIENTGIIKKASCA